MKWSKTGGGNERVTISNSDGSSRVATRLSDGSIVVTDRSSGGKETTGPGATGILGSLSSATRLHDGSYKSSDGK